MLGRHELHPGLTDTWLGNELTQSGTSQCQGKVPPRIIHAPREANT